MSIFSKQKKQHSQKYRKAEERPKLNVLATKPAILSQPQDTEWTLELVIPPEPRAGKPTSGSSPTSHVLSNLLHKPNEKSAFVASSGAANEKAVPVQTKYHYFSRLHVAGSSSTGPSDVVLRIFLTSFPSTITAKSTNQDELVQQVSGRLEAVHMTPDSASWLRQVLFSLQNAEIIPPLSHGLDVNKFMSFATSYLAQYLGEPVSLSTDECEVVNYSKVLHENERLKQRLQSNTTDYAVVNEANSQAGEMGDDEDLWTLPVRGKQTKHGKSWGGFWLSHGPTSGSTDNSSSTGTRQLEARNPYGGLM